MIFADKPHGGGGGGGGGSGVEIDTINETIFVMPKLSENIYDHSQNSMTDTIFTYICICVHIYVYS